VVKRARSRDQAREPFRVGGDVVRRGALRPRAQVALVEHQIEDREDLIEPLRELVALRQAKRDMRVDDLALRAHQTLRQSGLVDQERVRDLRGREPDDAPQCQRDLRLSRERGMAAGEDQVEALVRRVGRRAHFGAHLFELRELLAIARVAAQAVDPAMLRHDQEPGAGIRGYALSRPPFERGDQRVLHEIFGQREIA